MGKRILKSAVLAIDPGETTGVAAGYVDLSSTRKETLATLSHNKSIEIGGDWLSQGLELASLANRFIFTANVENAIPLPNIRIVIEDFILRRRTEGGATGNLTSCWVAAAMCGAYGKMVDPEVGDVRFHWQQPSEAKTLMTDARLREYGLWVVGSAHERDAWRHFGLRVDKLMTERGI